MARKFSLAYLTTPGVNPMEQIKMAKEAGYDFVAGKMTNLQTGEPLEIEVLSNSANGATFTKVMLPFIENLRKIGIKAVFRNLEVNIFKNRLDNFDFDMDIKPIAHSEEVFNKWRKVYPFFKNIERDGITIYDAA